MDIVSLLIQLVSGAVGGNIAGAALKDQSLGTIGNTIAGLVGGGVAGQLLPVLFGIGKMAAAGNLDIGSIITQVVSGGVGGGVLMAILGVAKQMMSK
jgi:uncharacterized membrane protein YeaQ/YmgE (transglycosylase-associated protein family)